MKLKCNGRNLYIIEKNAEMFDAITVTEGEICVEKGNENIISHIPTAQIYACMFCESLKNITLIIRGEEIYKVSFVLGDENVFAEVLNLMKETCVYADISEQNKKINGYAAGVIEKLKEGIEIGIIESKDKEDIPCCPACGVQCDPAIPYCMECGAAL